jgi:hypothetical protein
MYGPVLYRYVGVAVGPETRAGVERWFTRDICRQRRLTFKTAQPSTVFSVCKCQDCTTKFCLLKYWL